MKAFRSVARQAGGVERLADDRAAFRPAGRRGALALRRYRALEEVAERDRGRRHPARRNAEWINPAEIEAVVAALPQVSLAAVIGRRDHKWGERPILLVELREDHNISDDELLHSLEGHVASWWIPDAVVRLPAMPLAATGKIDKLSLRSTYSGA